MVFIYISRTLDNHPVIALSSFLLLAVAIPAAFAQGPSEEREDEEAAAREMGSYTSGNVLSVNPSTRSIVIMDDGGEPLSFRINKATTFTTASSLSDINAGDYVAVDYFIMDGINVAENILLDDRTPGEEKPEKLEKVLSD